MPKSEDFVPELNPMVKVRNLTKAFAGGIVLRDLNLDFARNEHVAIIGPSGSGKTSFLRVLMTLVQPDSGVVFVDGEVLWGMQADGTCIRPDEKHLYRVRKNIGMVFQQFNLFPHMKVLRNVTEAPISVLGKSRQEAEDSARDLLNRVGLSDKLDAYPAQLSGGQQQRVAIARALIMRPKIMLFDEITSALDPELVGEVLNVIRWIANDTDMTLLIVTHEMSFASEIADRVIFMESGAVEDDGPPEMVLRNSSNPRTRAFLKAIGDR